MCSTNEAAHPVCMPLPGGTGHRQRCLLEFAVQRQRDGYFKSKAVAEGQGYTGL